MQLNGMFAHFIKDRRLFWKYLKILENKHMKLTRIVLINENKNKKRNKDNGEDSEEKHKKSPDSPSFCFKAFFETLCCYLSDKVKLGVRSFRR